MLKTQHEGLLQAMASIFSDLLRGGQEVPHEWRVSKLVVLFKKGDRKMPANYRPIAIIPVMCKLVCGLILNRIKGELDALQPVEQTGFRPNFSCSDAVHTLRVVAEKTEEWGESLWVASLDLEKAFDKVFHQAVFQSLENARADPGCHSVLRQIYHDLYAFVALDGGRRSNVFAVHRGVRQGDPLSPILFNNVTKNVFGKLRRSWELRNIGATVGSDENGKKRLSHLMFADDTTLLATSRRALTTMIKETEEGLASYGLRLNIDKCQVQTNTTCIGRRSPIKIADATGKIVDAEQGFKILGTTFTLKGRTSAELKARIAAAWAKFHQLKPLLCNRSGSLDKRLRLFETCVSKTALWCCESWLLTLDEKRLLRTTQNIMLRRIVCPVRHPDEDWVHWIQRVTPLACSVAKKAGVKFWDAELLRRKWRWAGHVVRMPADRWARKVTEWRDAECCECKLDRVAPGERTGCGGRMS